MSNGKATAKGFEQQKDDLLFSGRKGSNDRYIISRLLEYVKPYKGLLVSAIVITLVGSILGPLRPFITKLAIDDYIAKGNINGLALISLVLLIIILLDGLKQYAAT